MLRDLPHRGRWYIIAVIVIGALTFGALVSRAAFILIVLLLFLVLLSSLTTAFGIQFRSPAAPACRVEEVELGGTAAIALVEGKAGIAVEPIGAAL